MIKLLLKTSYFLCLVQAVLFGEEWNTIYLSSFPRSGNHWVRFLVEEATHLVTGSTYRDREFHHLKKRFPWGGYSTDHGYNGMCRYPKKEDPILIKTHYPFLPRKVDPEPKAAICLVRHPIDALWSFYVYKEKPEGQEEGVMISKDQLMDLINSWKAFYEFWKSQPNVLFIRYEDLQESTSFHLSCLLQTAGFSFNETDVERAVAKYPPQGAPLKHIGCYDAESLEMIKTNLSDLLKIFNYDH